MLASLRIGTLMQLLFGGALVILFGMIAYDVMTLVPQKRAAERTVEVAKAGQNVFAALQNVRLERGPTRLTLLGKDPATAGFLNEVAALRAKSGPAVEELVRVCTAIVCSGPRDADEIRAAFAALETQRKEVDGQLRLPLERRSDGIAKRWNDAATALIDRLEALSDHLSTEIRLIDPIIAEQVEVKQVAYIMRDFAGLERNYYTEALQKSAWTWDIAQKIADHDGRIDSAWKLLVSLTSRPGEPKAVVEAVNRAKEAYFTRFVPKLVAIREAVAAGKPSPVGNDELVTESNVALDAIVAIATTALDTTRSYAEAKAAATSRELSIELILLAVALGMGAVGIFVIRSRIVRAISDIVEAMLHVARGELAVAIPHSQRKDEIGDLASALAVFKNNAAEKDHLTAFQRQEQTAKERRRTVVDEAIGEFDAVAQRALAAFSDAAGRMTATSQSMSATAEETSRQANAVAAASAEASANVETVAVSTEELSGSVSEIGRQVAQSAAIAARAVEEAQRTDATIRGLSEAAQKIGDVVQLIQDIASQTNLLALNATIEAARAGEAGKGFAVVASEVKSLANQTAKATEDISSQIGSIQNVTHDAVDAIRVIGATIKEVDGIATTIAAAIHEQGAATQEIARNVQEAARGVQDVTTNIVGVNRAAADTGGAAAHVTKAAAELNRHADTLRSQVATFLGKIRTA